MLDKIKKWCWDNRMLLGIAAGTATTLAFSCNYALLPKKSAIWAGVACKIVTTQIKTGCSIDEALTMLGLSRK